MPKTISIFFVLVTFFHNYSAGKQINKYNSNKGSSPIVSVNAFGAKANSGLDASIAFTKAVKLCNHLKTATLTMQPGVYEFKDKKAIGDFNEAMCGKLDINTPWGKQGFPFNQSMSFHNCSNITIDGKGAILRFSGLTQPLGFYGCHHITLKNIDIDDGGRLSYSIGEIQNISGDAVDLKIFDDFPVKGQEPVWCYVDYDPQDQKLAQVFNYGASSAFELTGPQTVRIHDPKAGEMKIGRWLIMQHIGVYRPAIHFINSDNISIENVHLLSHAGMGIIAHRCTNFNARRFEVRKGPARYRSINRDAVHFISCKGLIDFKDCYFESMGDDAINVHGFYLVTNKIIDEKTVEVGLGRETQDQQMDYPDKGDFVEFSNPETLQPVASGQVDYCQVDFKKNIAIIRFKAKIPANFTIGYLIANTTQSARLNFNQCTVRDNCARGALIQTRGALVANCLFDHCTGTGIDINTAKNWFESIGTRNVTIINNTFINCGYSLGAAKNSSGITVRCEAQPSVGIHKNMLLANNRIYGANQYGIFISSAENVHVADNVILNVPIGIKISGTKNYKLFNNIGGVIPLDISIP